MKRGNVFFLSKVLPLLGNDDVQALRGVVDVAVVVFAFS